MATLSLHVVDKRHARLLQHVADAWDLRETIRTHHAVSPDAIVGAGQDVIDEAAAVAQRTLDDLIRDRLVISRDITWWQTPEEGSSNDVDETEIDWRRMEPVEPDDLRNRAEQVLAANSLLVSFVVRAEALVLPPFVDGPDLT